MIEVPKLESTTKDFRDHVLSEDLSNQDRQAEPFPMLDLVVDSNTKNESEATEDSELTAKSTEEVNVSICSENESVMSDCQILVPDLLSGYSECESTDNSMLSFTGVEEMRQLTEKFTEISLAVNSVETLSKTQGKCGLIANYSDTFALPYFSSPRLPDLPQISDTVLIELIEGQFQDFIASFVMADCRYPYEYNGGHIRTAVNVHTAHDLNSIFFGNGKVEHNGGGRNIVVFYCEYSLERAPAMFRRLRDADRTKHKLQYPMLQYPEMYLLSGGYRKFFNNHPSMCTPPSYVEMTNRKYGNWSQCRRERAASFCDKRRNSEPIAGIRLKF
ncbi:hypothetical protein M514_08734 [Trichuris suis]|uniref:protein-tyrosine-phosphatase n=1 Tax=Trichuris suis TaxID=68888 RepID=A0A085N7D2_9BILA|nr:hypothetical protein M513_08734 [Trichuris suis]KFD65378.1 hypothetical protein M514_08734 [Trichuris suis]KHJ45049.1 rhodanese-like protein [Trichuris suis]